MQLTITLRRPPPALYCLPVSDFILKILSALSVSDFVTQRCCQMVSQKRHYFGLELLCGCRGREPSLLSIDNKIFMISPLETSVFHLQLNCISFQGTCPNPCKFQVGALSCHTPNSLYYNGLLPPLGKTEDGFSVKSLVFNMLSRF